MEVRNPAHDRAALKVMELAKALVLADNHFLSAAVGRMPIVTGEMPWLFATDALNIYADSESVCSLFKKAKEAPKHDLLHVVMHCLFLHPFVSPSVNQGLWSLACDICAERNVALMCGDRGGSRGERIADVLDVVSRRMNSEMTAEKVYHELAKGVWADKVVKWEELFFVDDHGLWYRGPDPQPQPQLEEANGSQEESDERSSKPGDGSNQGQGNRSSEKERGTEDGKAEEESREGDSQGEQRGEPQTSTGTSSANGNQGGDRRNQGDQGCDQAGPGESMSAPDNASMPKSSASGGSAESALDSSVSPGNSSQSDPVPDRPRSQGTEAGCGEDQVVSNSSGAALRELERVRQQDYASAPRAKVQYEEWKRVSRALAVNLQTYSRARGKELSSVVEELEASLHERVDYGDFLRQFATPGEVLKVSPDEFDYIFYTYGLSLYGNLPLIEPLEYREEKRIREFVIVIDTSGSVYGEIVRRFIDTTFDILKSTEAFFERVHVRIIQCDAQVQSDDVITTLDELREWGRTMKIRGMGGTDFRPAFAYVDELVEEGEFENLGGLIYFTDGWGQYPEWVPDYKCAFVFYDENYRKESVPSWAAQIVLDEQAVMG